MARWGNLPIRWGSLGAHWGPRCMAIFNDTIVLGKAKGKGKGKAKGKAKRKGKAKGKGQGQSQRPNFLIDELLFSNSLFLQYTLTPLKLRLLEYYRILHIQ